MDEIFPVEAADDDADDDFQDVQDLLLDHQMEASSQCEEFQEDDVAEVLAASLKERRQELGRLQKTRQFGKVKEMRRSFRVEDEELKAKRSCNGCGRRAQASGAAMVAHDELGEMDFVAAVSPMSSLIDLVRQRVHSVRKSTNVQMPNPVPSPSSQVSVALVSSPGFGVLDSGCGRTIVGEHTLREFDRLWGDSVVCLSPCPSRKCTNSSTAMVMLKRQRRWFPCQLFWQ